MSQKRLPVTPLGFYGVVESVFPYSLQPAKLVGQTAVSILTLALPPQTDTPTPGSSPQWWSGFPTIKAQA